MIGRNLPPCARCAELEEEVAYLKSELGLTQDTSSVHALRGRFKIDPQQARLLLTLYEANGRTLTTVFLHEAISSREHTFGSKLVHVRVMRLRKVLGKPAIETLYGLGYRLSAEGRALVCSALEDLAPNPRMAAE